MSTIPSALTDGLNQEQFKAVTNDNGNTLVLAGAGSGKTKVLTTRIAWLLETNRATEHSILAVTFTNKAANEMKTRVANITGRRPGKLWIGTFHGLCNMMLREFADQLGIPREFHIIDTDDQKSICKRLIKELGLKEEENIADVVDYINKIKEGVYERGMDVVKDDLFQRYTEICEREGAMDFSDLMYKTNVGLSQNIGGMRDHYRTRFSHILVDEFQDTNPEQYKWLGFLKSKQAEIFVVGDDDQSIYSFRGATPENMKNFVSGVREDNLIRLEQNYRSTNHILSAANGVISHNSGRIGKTLRTDAGDGALIDVCHFDNNMRESDFIAKQIKEMMARGSQPDEIAILYRSNHQSGSIEKSLLRANIPYIIHGGTRFFERQEIKDAIAYLRIALNAYDDSAFYRVVNFPPRGMGSKAIERIEEAVRYSEFETCLLDVARVSQGKAKAFTDIVDDLSERMNSMSLSDAIVYMYETSGLLKHYTDSDDDKARVNHLKELVSLAKRYSMDEAKPEYNTKQQAMEFIAQFTLEDTKEQDKNFNQKNVVLMTVHAAKGLEFNHVFITGAEQGLMPHKNSLEEGGLQVEEERRLMYVAITRAKKRLMITHTKERMIFGEKIECEPSQFIAELPDASIKHHSFLMTEAEKTKMKQLNKNLSAKHKYGSKTFELRTTKKTNTISQTSAQTSDQSNFKSTENVNNGIKKSVTEIIQEDLESKKNSIYTKNNRKRHIF